MEGCARKLYVAALFTIAMALVSTGCIPATATQTVEVPPTPSATATALPTEAPSPTPNPDFTTPAYCAVIGDRTITTALPEALQGSGETSGSINSWFLSLNKSGTIFTANAGDVLRGSTGVDDFTYVGAVDVFCVSENRTSAAIHAASSIRPTPRP